MSDCNISKTRCSLMKRAELNQLAINCGLDPKQFSRKGDLCNALVSNNTNQPQCPPCPPCVIPRRISIPGINDIEKMTVAQLKEVAKSLGLPYSNKTKAILKANILAKLGQNQATPLQVSVAPREVDLTKMTIPQLKQFAKDKGIKGYSSIKKKADLIAFIQSRLVVSRPVSPVSLKQLVMNAIMQLRNSGVSIDAITLKMIKVKLTEQGVDITKLKDQLREVSKEAIDELLEAPIPESQLPILQIPIPQRIPGPALRQLKPVVRFAELPVAEKPTIIETQKPENIIVYSPQKIPKLVKPTIEPGKGLLDIYTDDYLETLSSKSYDQVRYITLQLLGISGYDKPPVITTDKDKLIVEGIMEYIYEFNKLLQQFYLRNDKRLLTAAQIQAKTIKYFDKPLPVLQQRLLSKNKYSSENIIKLIDNLEIVKAAILKNLSREKVSLLGKEEVSLSEMPYEDVLNTILEPQTPEYAPSPTYEPRTPDYTPPVSPTYEPRTPDYTPPVSPTYEPRTPEYTPPSKYIRRFRSRSRSRTPSPEPEYQAPPSPVYLPHTPPESPKYYTPMEPVMGPSTPILKPQIASALLQSHIDLFQTYSRFKLDYLFKEIFGISAGKRTNEEIINMVSEYIYRMNDLLTNFYDAVNVSKTPDEIARLVINYYPSSLMIFNRHYSKKYDASMVKEIVRELEKLKETLISETQQVKLPISKTQMLRIEPTDIEQVIPETSQQILPQRDLSMVNTEIMKCLGLL